MRGKQVSFSFRLVRGKHKKLVSWSNQNLKTRVKNISVPLSGRVRNYSKETTKPDLTKRWQKIFLKELLSFFIS